MNTTARTPDLRKLSLIANARLATLTYAFNTARRDAVRPPIMRSVLLTVLMREGTPTSLTTIADESGCSLSAAHRTIRCLTRDGIVIERVNSSHARPSEYEISAERLAQLIPPSPHKAA